jgi:hypothetical protein
MPATNAKPRDEFAGPHRFATFRGLISSRHRDACRPVVTGLKVVLSEVSSIGLPSIHNFKLRLASPAGFQAARLASRPRSCAPVLRFEIILKRRVEGGRCPFASGTPATRGAHNSEKPMQQPDHQSLVRESIPSRITVALSVDTLPGPPSRCIGDYLHANLT